MAKITLSESAPADARFSLANVSFTAPFETDDPAVIANASVHPWLEVKSEASASEAVFFVREIKEAVSIANDPTAVAAELKRRRAELAPAAAPIDEKPKGRSTSKDKE